MSFILDALKKSETDRQQSSAPGIAEVPTAVQPPQTPRGVWVLVGLLFVTIVLLLGLLLKPTPTAQVAQPEYVQPPLPVAAEPVVRPAADSRSSAQSASEPSPVAASQSAATTEDQPTAANEPVERPAATSSANLEVSEPAPTVRAAEPPQDANGSPDTSSYLTFNDVRASGNIGLPDLHIDLHVYSDNPAERFVFINMNEYRENATLSEGPRLQSIVEEGVLLEYIGTTFLLPRE